MSTAVFLKFLLLFAVVPLLELWLLVELTHRTSLPFTLLLVITTATVGISLVRWQGLVAWRQIQDSLRSGQSPAKSILSGVLILISGALLLTPGILTDVAGFLLLAPPVRNAIAAAIQKQLVTRTVTGSGGGIWFGTFSARYSDSEFVPESQASSEPDARVGVRVIDPDAPRISDHERDQNER